MVTSRRDTLLPTAYNTCHKQSPTCARLLKGAVRVGGTHKSVPHHPTHEESNHACRAHELARAHSRTKPTQVAREANALPEDGTVKLRPLLSSFLRQVSNLVPHCLDVARLHRHSVTARPSACPPPRAALAPSMP